ncbi:hypothetical protein KY361_05725 [Candidatus Woesearchaeota archaeon]|nr:hypothetical protein [Candidatus Woesearchaeota archaeon]
MNKAVLKQLKKQLILTLIVLTLLVVLNFNIPLSPSGATTNRTILFEWIGLANRVLIDDNPSFSSPIMISGKETASLPPGEYYWRTTGFSAKKRFILDSEVAISLKKLSNHSYNIENKGNVNALLETLRNKDWGITGAAALNLGEGLNSTITEQSTFLASQNE